MNSQVPVSTSTTSAQPLKPKFLRISTSLGLGAGCSGTMKHFSWLSEMVTSTIPPLGALPVGSKCPEALAHAAGVP